MNIQDLEFELPPELIAQSPSDDRASSRLMHYCRTGAAVAHRIFRDLPLFLRPGDLLVFNDAQVLPARFTLRKHTGGRVDGLFLGQRPDGVWNVLLKNVGPLRSGVSLAFAEAPEIEATITTRGRDGEFTLDVATHEPAETLLRRIGRMPLPPYIRRAKDHDPRDEFDRERYQTVYGAAAGSVAAPTAGLHFTPELLAQLDASGVVRTFVTLHVGLGTFKPIAAAKLEDHRMHEERYSISDAAAQAINAAKHDRRRVVAVGTTTARVIESQPENRPFEPFDGQTDIFIRPPYHWKRVDALITNFHLPRSTLIALVAALVGLEEQQRLYRLAVEQRYRFFSYGDAMLLE